MWKINTKLLNIFRNAFKNINPNYLNNVQKTQMTGLLAKYEKELIEVQRKRAEWSSMKNISQHLIRKRVLLQKLKPLQVQMNTLKKLGIPMANIIATPNGILPQVGAIRNEVYQALMQARKDYYETTELLKNPDIITPMVKYPMDPGVTKLPENPDQSEPTESPFFNEQDQNQGVR
jgi:flagellar biosynthesis regulator FlbT